MIDVVKLFKYSSDTCQKVNEPTDAGARSEEAVDTMMTPEITRGSPSNRTPTHHIPDVNSHANLEQDVKDDAVYPYWRERKQEREGLRIIPTLNVSQQCAHFHSCIYSTRTPVR